MQTIIRKLLPETAVLLFLTVICGFFFWRLFTPTQDDQLAINPNGDFGVMYYNFSGYQAVRFAEGDLLPQWNPNNYGGSPFLADFQMMSAYPVRWLMLALHGNDWNYLAIHREVVLHFWLSSLLMYAFVRRLTGSVLGGLVASIAFAYGGYYNSYPPEQETILASGTWFPFVLWMLLEGTRQAKNSAGWFILSGVGIALVFLAGHPQITLMAGYLAVAFLSYRVFTGSRSWTHWLSGIGLFGLVGAGLSAVILLPGVEYLAFTPRESDFNYLGKSTGYLFQNIFQVLWATHGIYTPWYIGGLGLCLAIAALLYEPLRARFWLGVALLGLLLGFGGKTALFQVFYVFLPGFELFRNYERTLLLWALGMAVLSGIGVASLARHAHTARPYWLAGIGGFVLLAGLYFLAIYNQSSGEFIDLNRDMAGYTLLMSLLLLGVMAWFMAEPQQVSRQAALIGLLIFDLFSISQGAHLYVQTTPETVLLPPPWVESLRPALVADPFSRIDTTDQLGAYGSLHGLPDIQGTSPLLLKNTRLLLDTLPRQLRWEMFAVRYVIATDAEFAVPSRIFDTTFTNYLGQTQYLHELENPRPLGLWVYAVDEVADAQSGALMLASPDYPRRDRAILLDSPPLTLPDQPPSTSSVELQSIEPETLTLHATSTSAGLLTLALPYHPGWQAWVNGKQAKLLPANVAFMALPLEAGQYDIRLEFRSTAFVYGRAISLATALLTVLLLTGWLLMNLRGHRPKPA